MVCVCVCVCRGGGEGQSILAGKRGSLICGCLGRREGGLFRCRGLFCEGLTLFTDSEGGRHMSTT